MQKQLQEWVNSLGLKVEISLERQANSWHFVETDDGFKGSYIFKEIRFSEGMSLWVTIYDYKKAQSYSQRFDSRTLTDDEIQKVELARKQLDEKLTQQKEKIQKDCKDYCLKEWAKHEFTDTCDYFTKKGVSAPPNVFKLRHSELGGSELLCPMYDENGEFWGYQIISERRGKDFNLGQRTDGVFVPISMPDNPSRIYISEGVATALSVFMGGGGAVACLAALSASNLPKVARALRRKYPKTPLVVMADNDQWTPDNPGIRFAERACQDTDGTVYAAPEFPHDTPGKPTDWNDFHKFFGLEALKSEIDAITTLRPEYFWPLGHNRGTYYFTNLRAPEIHSTKDFSPTDLLKILSLEKWKSLFPEHVNRHDKLEWEGIKSLLIDMGQKKGHFRLDESRGLGMYLEKGKTLVHLGDRVYFDGHEIELQDFESDTFYDLKFRRALPPKHPEYDFHTFIKTLYKILKGYTWEHPLSTELVMGWLYCAYASGGLSWRPHLLVSAKAGSGKTTIANMIVEELLQYSGYVKKEDATEAGVRQELENNAVPLIHDEFDTNKGEPKRLASVLNLLRAASSGGSISRGTPSGRALRFEARFCAYLTGINPPVLNEADQTRITVLRLLKQNPRPWAELEKEILKVVDSRGASGIFWRVVETLPNFFASASTLQKALGGHGERVGQQYGAMLAGFWHLQHDSVIDEATAKELNDRVSLASETIGEKIAENDNAERCLAWLFDLKVRVHNEGELTVGQLIEQSRSGGVSQQLYERELAGIGIKIENDKMFVDGSQATLKKWFADTQWQNYLEALLRIDSADRARVRVGGKQARGVSFALPK